MRTTLQTSITVAEIYHKFVFNQPKNKNLFQVRGVLTVQPTYQHPFHNADGSAMRAAEVVESLLKAARENQSVLTLSRRKRSRCRICLWRLTSIG